MNMKKFSSRQEKRVAKQLNGKLQPGSGAVNVTGLKGDVRVDNSSEWDLLVECKTKAVKPGQGVRSMTVQKSWIKDVQNHAFDMGKSMGVVALSFDGKENFYLIGEHDFLNMYQAVRDYEQLIQKYETALNQIVDETNDPNVIDIINNL